MRLYRLIAISLCWLGLAFAGGGVGQAQSRASQTVASSEALYAALAQARGGETILLVGGDYGKLLLAASTKFNITFAAPVTIASADPGNPAVFSGLDLRDAENLILDGLVFDYTFRPDHPIYLRPFQIVNSTRITLRNSTFDGDLARGVSDVADGLGWAFGLALQGVSEAVIENNEFFDFFRGLVVGGGSGTVVRGNEMHAIRMDGMNFAHVHDILIEGNYFHDFNRSKNPGDHSDMIQFWTNGGTRPSTGITIRGNVLMAGAGGSTQSIFMRNDMVDRGLAGREMFYRDVLIEDNVIINGHVHGITLGESDGVIIRRNTLLRNQSFAKGAARQKKVTIPSINLKGDSVRVTLEGNLAPGFPKPKKGWTMRGNMVVQDISPMQPGYYLKVFTDALQGDPQDLDSFAYLPGGPADDPRLGAPLLRPGADRVRYKPRRRRNRCRGLLLMIKSGSSGQTVSGVCGQSARTPRRP